MAFGIDDAIAAVGNVVASVINSNTQDKIAQTELQKQEVNLEIVKKQGATAVQVALLEKKIAEQKNLVDAEIAKAKSRNKFYGIILLFFAFVVFVFFRISSKQLDNEKIALLSKTN